MMDCLKTKFPPMMTNDTQGNKILRFCFKFVTATITPIYLLLLSPESLCSSASGFIFIWIQTTNQRPTKENFTWYVVQGGSMRKHSPGWHSHWTWCQHMETSDSPEQQHQQHRLQSNNLPHATTTIATWELQRRNKKSNSSNTLFTSSEQQKIL